MAIPDFQSVMLPVLKTLSDGREWQMKDVTKAVEDSFNLTDAERAEMLPSGFTRVMVNRVGWAKSYMKAAGLIHSVRRGIVQITDEGECDRTSGVKAVKTGSVGD